MKLNIKLIHTKIESEMDEKGKTQNFNFLLEQFSDIKIMQYQVPGFENLSLKQKELVYYLSQAALCGRDIIFDQNYKHNLTIRRTNEAILNTFAGDRSCSDFENFEIYAKRVWFSNGIHHHYSTDKFVPEISIEYFIELINHTNPKHLPINSHESVNLFIERIVPIIFDAGLDAKRIVLDSNQDIISSSANNFYEGITEKEVLHHNESIEQTDNNKPISAGLNSKLEKRGNKIFENTYKLGGLYSEAIKQIIYWLSKAVTVAENEAQKEGLLLLINYYETGNLEIWDKYNVVWVKDTESMVDYVNGFIETYGDPLGMKATWESVVNFKDIIATKRATIISSNAQWFEDNAPIDIRFKKQKVTGISAKVITVAQLGGDCYPATPIGINLPNADWIRRDHGSKSVSMENITYAYDKAAQGNGFLEEFCYSQKEIKLAQTYGPLASNLHTDLHECLGHGSGQLLLGVNSDALKNFSSTLEEARADLFALYYLADEKMIELNLVSNFDLVKAEYNAYLRNGLMTQLTRVELGKNIEQAHMRNRQLISRWCYENGRNDKVIDLIKKNGKTYVFINNHRKLRVLFGTLLAEVQRIKSEGDFEAGKKLVEAYAIKVDRALHEEVLTRYKKLNIAPYGGFVNPILIPKMKNEKITDVTIEYSQNFKEQMLWYSNHYSFLPNYNF